MLIPKKTIAVATKELIRLYNPKVIIAKGIVISIIMGFPIVIPSERNTPDKKNPGRPPLTVNPENI